METRRLVKDSGVLVMPTWNLSSIISLDEIRIVLSVMLLEETYNEKTFGSRFSPSLHVLDILSLTPNLGRCRLSRTMIGMIGYLIIGMDSKMTAPQAT